MEGLVKLGAVCLLLATVTAVGLIVNYTTKSSKRRISFGLFMMLIFMILLVSILTSKWQLF